MACTGIEFCKLAIVETKDRAAELVAELEQRMPELDTPITVHLNGCPNSCARIQVADIGLKGQLVLDGDGDYGRGLPGAPRRRPRARGRASAASCAAHKVTSDEAHRLRRDASSGATSTHRHDGERFAAWAARADEEALR